MIKKNFGDREFLNQSNLHYDGDREKYPGSPTR